MSFVALAIATLVLFAAQPARREILVQVRELWARWLEKCWGALVQTSWGKQWLGWLLAVVGSGIIVQALVSIIASDSVVLTLLLHSGMLVLAMSPLDVVDLEEDQSLTETALRVVGVVFWYMIGGVLGLVVARLAWSAVRERFWLPQSGVAKEWIWWLPARLLVMSFAVVGNFHSAIEPLARHLGDPPGEMDASELVAESVPAALSPLWDDLDESERLIQSNALLRRAMLALLVLLAIVSIF